MPGIDKAPRRVVAVIVLLIVAAAALHGYLPGADRPPRDRSTGGFGSLFTVVAMLVVSMAIIVIAVITHSRRRPVPYGAGEHRRELTGERRPLTWRMVLIAVAVVIAWLLLVAVLSRLNMQPGVEQQPPNPGTPPTGPPKPPAQPQQPEPSSGLFSALAGATVLFMMVVFVGAAIAGRRQRRRATPIAPLGEYRPATGVLAADPFARAAEVGLAEIEDLSREPREAIIACYAAMERELENSPEIIPRESDTPSEVLARAVEHHALRADTATELVDLFEEARFSPHVMTESHRATAVRVLRLVLAELRSMA
jgi:heme/copper-type cytochrome/quinol oxidase subunit 2